MVQWYYAVGQDQKGPFERDDFVQLIKSGQVGRYTLVWHSGMDIWKKAGEHPDLLSEFIAPPPLPPLEHSLDAAEKEPSPVVPRGLKSRPWPRFWARYIDNLLVGPLLAFGFGLWALLYAPDFYLAMTSLPSATLGLLLLPLVGLFLALCMTVTGTTIGKAIIGVKVQVPNGRNRLGFFLAREMQAWISGLGLGVPFIAVFTAVRQYRRLSSGLCASYDVGTAVVSDPTRARLTTGVLLGLALFVGNVVIQAADTVSTKSLNEKATWINPITNKSASITKAWKPEELKTNSGRAFHFTSDELLSELVFGYEQLNSELIDTKAYAEAIKKAIAGTVTLEPNWKPVSVAGVPALMATGKYSDGNVEVTILTKGRNAWRTIAFTRGSSPAQSSARDSLVHAVFGSAN